MNKTEFQFKKNVNIVVDFIIGEKILIQDWGYKMNGEHTIEAFKTNFGGCESGIMVKISGYDSWIDIGWLNKNNNQNLNQ
jgi:hypothetical protein